METKTCTKCGETKLMEAFRPRRNTCRACCIFLKDAWQKANPEKCSTSSAKWQKANPGKCRAVSAKKRGEITKSYISSCIRIPVADITPDLLELKREQIKLIRLTRQLNKTIKEIQK